MPFYWHPHVVCCVPKTPIPSPRFVLSTTLSPSLRSCSRLLFPRGTPVTWKEKSPPSRHIAAKTPDPKISGPAPTPVQKPALSSDRQQATALTGTKEAEDEFFDYVYVAQFGKVEASYRGSRAYECSISLDAPFSDYASVLRSVGIRRVTKPFRMSDTRLLFRSNLGNALLADFPDVIVGVFIPEDGARSGWIVRFLQQ